MIKKYDQKAQEKIVQDLWEKEQTYSIKNSTGQLYTIDTPPPTVSGNLHIGHIFSYTQTDVIARYKRMNGFRVAYPFGFDDNGLPTERYVEKKRGVSAHKMGRSAFIAVCLEETELAEKEFMDLWKQMGLSADWNALYSTISDATRALSQESFIKLYEKNYIYRKNEPAPYCTTCYTSVAQAELDDQETSSFFNNIVFKDENGSDLIIGTTRPELLSSCVALFYNPQDDRYTHLQNKQAVVPIFGNKVPVYPDEKVEITKGTGLVMCCTFGDTTDIAWYKQFSLDYKQSIGRDGRWIDPTGTVSGKKVADARETIIALLKERNLLLTQKPITHTVNVHERCQKEIEYLMLPQWFLNIIDHKQKFIELADQINWHPAFMKTRYLDWVQNIGWDWCLSRQRFYGIPFPVWHCNSCNKILLADKKDLPIDPQEIAFSGSCTDCGSTDITPDTDVMDTWNTSSITPYICYKLFSELEGKKVDPFAPGATQDFLPMSMRPQAHDIIRTWAFYTIVKVWMHHGTLAWKDIVISGHVLSSDKNKLSKSKGQKLLAPQALLEQYCADVIRYWTSASALGQDTPFSEAQLKVGQRLVTKLWNAFIFIHEHTVNFIASEKLGMPADLLARRSFNVDGSAVVSTKEEARSENGKTSFAVNQWIIHQATECFVGYQNSFESYEFSAALAKVEKFFWHSFCDNYLELIKNQLCNPENFSQEQITETKRTLYDVGLRILQLYAPYIPHVTESIYQELYKNNLGISSLHQTKFADTQQVDLFPESANLINSVVELVSSVRKLKTAQQLSLKTELQILAIFCADSNLREALKKEDQLIAGVTQAKKVIYITSEARDEKIEDSLEEKEACWYARVQL